MKPETNHSLEDILKKKSEMNISVNTQNGDVYVGGTKPKNILHKDDSGFFVVDGYGKFMNKKYPIKKYFTNSLEIAAINQYINN